jgi:hypothetical protein
MEEIVNPYLHQTILEIVDKQIEELTPPETSNTLNRLIDEGFSQEEAKRLIGCIVSSEIFRVLKDKKPFNLERFVEGLKGLPDMPSDWALEYDT